MFQAMPLDPACTYGSARTGVFDRRNNIAAMNLYDSSSTMKIPINFTWPVSHFCTSVPQLKWLRGGGGGKGKGMPSNSDVP